MKYTGEKVVNNEEMIDTSTSKQLPELEESK